MTLLEKLGKIQSEMKVPKSLWNSFGKYHYRNAESIQEAVKPFESKYHVCLVISDEIVDVGGRIYVKATASLYDLESSGHADVSAYAREPEDKKGMDCSQVTGATSSYARKYALNGLFLLDDTKDPDTDEAHVESEARSQIAEVEKQKISDVKAKALQEHLDSKGVIVSKILKQCNVQTLNDLTEKQYVDIVAWLSTK